MRRGSQQLVPAARIYNCAATALAMLGRAAFISRMESTEMAETNAPVWLITGCSTGFGRELSRAVLARGYRVVVTARNPESIESLVAGHEGQAIALKLDVTS